MAAVQMQSMRPVITLMIWAFKGLNVKTVGNTEDVKIVGIILRKMEGSVLKRSILVGKIIETIETEYDRGDLVLFQKNGFEAGIIEGMYVDHSAGCSVWYNIRTSKTNVYTYTNGGDIAEWDIIGKIEGALGEKVRNIILEKK